MKRIELSKGKFTIVDDEDYEMLSQFAWHCNNGYARTVIYLHNLVVEPEEGKFIDHKNLDRLDNRKENLRLCDRSQSQTNRSLQFNNTSGFRGVTKTRNGKKWRASVRKNNKKVYLGVFNSKEEAAKAYNKEAERLHEDFARLNLV